MSLYFTNEWFIHQQVVDKKTCNKIKNLGKGNWEESSVDTSAGTTDEERRTGKKGDYKTDRKMQNKPSFLDILTNGYMILLGLI